MPSDPSPLIIDIKRGSHEDGPGIRSVVFFKGCPLRCIFCQNPEAQNPGAEIAFNADACTGCGACVEACPNQANQLELPGRIRRDRCQCCGACADACPARGLRLIGKPYTVDQLQEVLLRDQSFYRHSGGGVTLSGGECTLYPRFTEALLRALKGQGVHLALQTCGHFDYGEFSAAMLPHLDLIYFDLKIADPHKHREHTGRSNHKIIENIRRLLAQGDVEVHPRIPLVPGVTDSEENLTALVKILRQAGAKRVSLLPYNPLGLQMAENLGRPIPLLPSGFMEPHRESQIFELFGKLTRSMEHP